MKQAWFTVSELADLKISGLPIMRNRMVEYVAKHKWSERFNAAGEPLFRKRAGKGGGFEYHASLFPVSARLDLIKRGLLEPAYAPDKEPLEPVLRTADWTWFDAQSDKVKAEAQRRLDIILAVEALASTTSQSRAVGLIAAENKVSNSTIWEWLSLVKGVEAHDRLPVLAPRHKGGGVKASIDADLLRFFTSYVLRHSKTGFAEAYRATIEEAQRRGVPIGADYVTYKRRLIQTVPSDVITLRRDGVAALKKSIPAQKRTVAGMTAMELVNIDGHKWDVFVRWPAKNGQPERIGRPITVAIQDVMSRKMLSWRTAQSETSQLTQLAFKDLFQNWGIPQGVLMDNGRAFASKWISGGAKTRFRFKVRDTDPCGILTSLGIKIHWATPAHGQAKPIERSFRDLEEVIGRHPLCQGAYTGNHIDAKPEDYGSRAIDIDVFEALLAKGMAAYNARLGRRTEMTQGGCFDETFMASYRQHPVGQATKEQLRMCLMAADQVRANRDTGAIELYGNRYWCDAMRGLAGDMLTVRFDPDDFHAPVSIYTRAGQFVCEAPIIAATGFLDLEGAKASARMNAELVKRTRELNRIQDLISAEQLAAMIPLDVPNQTKETPKVARPVKMRGSAAALKLVDQAPEHNLDHDWMRAVERVAAREFQVFDGGKT